MNTRLVFRVLVHGAMFLQLGSAAVLLTTGAISEEASAFVAGAALWSLFAVAFLWRGDRLECEARAIAAYLTLVEPPEAPPS